MKKIWNFRSHFKAELEKSFADIALRIKQESIKKSNKQIRTKIDSLKSMQEGLLVFAHRLGYEVLYNNESETYTVRQYKTKSDKANLDAYLMHY